MLQILSFTITIQQLKSIYELFFVSCCKRCRGTGIITCPHVSGFGLGQGRAGLCRQAGQGRQGGAGAGTGARAVRV